jgi:hypothetical protein
VGEGEYQSNQTDPNPIRSNPPQHLIARSEAGLAETRRAAEEAAAVAGGSSSGLLRVWTWPLDLGDLDALPARLDAVFQAVKQQQVKIMPW